MQVAMGGESEQLLVVDDEQPICELLSQFLRKKGYSVHEAFSGEEAQELLKSRPIDLVVTDIKMPQGISGVELLKWIKESDLKIPVFITTGFPTMDTAIEALKNGAQDYLTKPFRLEEIAEKIRRALASKRMEEENLLFSKLVSLHEVTKVLASTLDPAELNRTFLDYSLRLSKADSGALFLLDSASRFIISETVGEYVQQEYWRARPFTRACKWVSRNQESLVVESGSEELPAGLLPLPEHLRSCILFPLKTNEKFVGVLLLVRNTHNGSFSNLDLETISTLSSQASISIENVRLYENIRNNYLSTIRAFALAVEAKDEYTHGHSENVMKYTMVLGKHLGMSDSELELVKYAGLLHDIGKIGICENILNKAGRLTSEEYELIKKHPELGAKIISDVPFLKPLVPLVLHHHEFFNGAGYPFGLSGEEIPFGSRVLSVSDAYEAMTSDRPYRKSLSMDFALEILFKERGKQFDPNVVDAFLEIMGQ